jgi:hypothetical protein
MTKTRTVTEEQAQTPVQEPVLGGDHPLRDFPSPDSAAQTSSPGTHSSPNSTNDNNPGKPPATINSPLLSLDPDPLDREGSVEKGVEVSDGSKSAAELSYGSASEFGDLILEELIKLEEDHCRSAMRLNDMEGVKVPAYCGKLALECKRHGEARIKGKFRMSPGSVGPSRLVGVLKVTALGVAHITFVTN